MRRAPAWAFLLLVVAVTLTACGGEEGTDEAEGSQAETGPIHVILEEWTIVPMEGSTFTAAAGEVTFEVHNDGTVPHELVVIKTDLEPDALPVSDGQVDERQVQVIGELEEFPAGEIETGSFELEAGSYVLICNIPGHYEQGMHARLTVG